jgi:hypothetical protein
MTGRQKRCSRGVRRGGVALLASVAALLAPSAASATISYEVEQTDMAANNTAEAQAFCDAGESLVSGAGYLGTAHIDSEIRSLAPLDGPDSNRTRDDGWSAMGNAGENATDVESYAVCSDKGKFKYRSSKPKSVPAAESARARCDDGYRVVGGGIETSRNTPSTLISIVASTPVGAKTNSKSDDGWKGRVNNASGLNTKITAWAICAKDIETTSVKDVASPVPNETQQFLRPVCPNGLVATGGGAAFKGTPGGTYLQTTYPEAYSSTEDKWVTYLNNRSGFDQSMVGYTVCSDL